MNNNEQCCGTCIFWEAFNTTDYGDCKHPIPEAFYMEELSFRIRNKEGKECPCYIVKDRENG
jgi:hypothetical protein